MGYRGFLGLFLRLRAIMTTVYFRVVGYRDGAPPLVGFVGRLVLGDLFRFCRQAGTGLGINGNELH